MPDDSFYTNDAAFMAGKPSDQLAYIAANDADFAKGNPVDQLSYLSHLTGGGPVQGPQLPQPPMQEPSKLAGLAGVPGGSPNVPIASNAVVSGTAGLLGAAAVGSIPGAGTAIKAAGRALPYVAASEGINYARQNLPLGKYIPPGAELLPFFMGGGKPEETPQPKKFAPPPLRYSPQPEPAASPTAAPPPLRWNESMPDRVPTTRAEGGPPEGAPVSRLPADIQGAYDTALANKIGWAVDKFKTNPEQFTIGRSGGAVAIGKTPMPGPRPNGPYSGPNTPASMEPAQSGMIAKHGYIPESRTMVTEFNNGKVYQYTGVPKEIYDNFRNAESQGSFFAQNIKGRYTTRYRGSVSPTRSGQ